MLIYRLVTVDDFHLGFKPVLTLVINRPSPLQHHRPGSHSLVVPVQVPDAHTSVDATWRIQDHSISIPSSLFGTTYNITIIIYINIVCVPFC